MNQERNPFTQSEQLEKQNPFDNNVLQGDPFVSGEELATKPKPWAERGKGILILLGFYGTQFLTGIVLVAIIYASGMDESTFDSAYMSYSFMAMALVDIFVMVILAIKYRAKISESLKKVFGSFGMFFLKIIGYFALYWFATVFFSIIDMTLFPDMAAEVGENQELIESALTESLSVWVIIAICIGAPIIEEYVFRYGFINKLLFGLNRYVAAVIAAFIFSFMHIGFAQITSPEMFVHLMLGYIGQALVFGIVYAREDNLIYPIFIHFLGNSQAVLLITLFY